VGNSKKRKTVPAGYSLDPWVVDTISNMAKELNVTKSGLVNYMLDRVIRATEEAVVIEDPQRAKKIYATNRSIMNPLATALTYDLCVHLEFVNELV